MNEKSSKRNRAATRVRREAEQDPRTNERENIPKRRKRQRMDLDVRCIYPHPVSYNVPPQIVALVTLTVGNDFAPPAKN